MSSPVTDRINLVYENHAQQSVELPMRLLVLSDLTCDERSEDASSASIIQLDAGVDQLMASLNLSLNFTVENRLDPNAPNALLVEMPLNSVEDMNPESLLMGIPALSSAYELYRLLGDENVKVSTLIADLGDYGFIADEYTAYHDRLVIQQALHERINEQLNLVIHHDSFVKLESSWRSLHFLYDYLLPKENMSLSILNVNKQALMEDFEDAPDTTQSSLYRLVYSAEFGQFGGRPYTLMVADYEFSPAQQDVALLTSLSQLAAMGHCPILSAASSKLFGLERYQDFASIRDVSAHFEQPQYTKWNQFRRQETSRYVCLTLPKFLLRGQYRIQGQGFEFEEDNTRVGLWGNSAFALATRFLSSFGQYRWFINVTGEQYGLVDDIHMHETQTQLGKLIPTEVLVSDKIANQLVNNGLTPLTIYRKTGKAGFAAIPSCHIVNYDEVDPQSLLNQTLETQIPYMLISCRFSQYIKVMQRENIGSWLTRSQIDQSINRWLKQYVSDMDNPAPAVRARRPLRDAKVLVRDVEGKSGWFMSTITLTPHFKYMGKPFTLSERGRLEKA